MKYKIYTSCNFILKSSGTYNIKWKENLKRFWFFLNALMWILTLWHRMTIQQFAEIKYIYTRNIQIMYITGVLLLIKNIFPTHVLKIIKLMFRLFKNLKFYNLVQKLFILPVNANSVCECKNTAYLSKYFNKLSWSTWNIGIKHWLVYLKLKNV